MSADGSRTAVVAALAANIGIAVAKFAGFAVTRSSSMLAEAAHSLADCGNQALLLLGHARAKRAPDERHAFGRARETYFWAFVVSIVLFTAGAGFALREGLHKLHDTKPLESPAVAITILLAAIVLEGLSFRTAARVALRIRGSDSWWTFIRRNKSADLTVVLLEDAAALVGLVFALTGIGLSIATGDPRFDAAGTLAIAALLAAVAVVLAVETKSLLIGESATGDEVDVIRSALMATPGIDAVIHLRTEHRSANEILVAAKVAFRSDMQASEMAAIIDAAEARIREAIPAARYIFIEPDILR